MSWWEKLGILSISVYSCFHHECVLLLAICTAWSENIFTDLWGSSELVHLFDSAFFLVGLFHTFSSSLFFCPLAIACFSVIHLTGMTDFKNWLLLILTSRTQPRTLNQASLHSTVAPPIYHFSTLLYPPSALTWPHLASSRVLYNTEHSTNICYIKQKQWLGNKQDKHNGMIMWHVAEDKMDPSSIGGGHQEDTTTSWIMSWTWAIRGSLPLPCPWNMVSACLPLSQRLL